MQALIVGAGPVGLTLALELRRRGLDLRIIDRSPEPSPYSRALVIHCRTQEMMEEAGLREAIARHAIELRGMSLRRDGRTLASIPFNLGRYTAISLPQQETERILASQLEDLGVHVERGRELTSIEPADDLVETVVGGEALQARYVLGCDGAHSTVRHLLGVPFEGESLPETLWLADARVDWELTPDHVWQLLHPSGPLTAVPMPGGIWRLVTLRQTDEGEPTSEFFEHAIALRTGIKTRVTISWLSTFRVNCRLAAGYGTGRVILAGDAAHIHSPIGGQGMNIGVQDAFSLASRLADGMDADPEEVRLGYERERRPVAARVIRANARVTRLAMGRGLLAGAVRDFLMPRLLNLAPVSRRAGLEASGLVS